MIKINRSRVIPKGNLVENLTKIMDKEDAEILVNQLEDYQKFQEEMKRMIQAPDEIQLELEKRMDKERFLERFKVLHFNLNYSLPEAIEEAKKEVDLTEDEITEILEVIVKAAV